MKRSAKPHKYAPEQIRDGIFALNTRRFGTVAEHLIKILANADWGKSIAHDLFDKNAMKRIEVKFCRALRANPRKIKESNIIDEIVSASSAARMFASTEWKTHQFDCNIQQIKKAQFDILYYGIFFSDKAQIFKITPEQIDKRVRYSDKQHFGNVGEGQFHLNNTTYQYHLNNFLETELTYKDILDLLMELQDTGRLNQTVLAILLPIFATSANLRSR